MKRAKGDSCRVGYLINFRYQHLSVKMSFMYPAEGNKFQPVFRGRGFLSKVMQPAAWCLMAVRAAGCFARQSSALRGKIVLKTVVA